MALLRERFQHLKGARREHRGVEDRHSLVFVGCVCQPVKFRVLSAIVREITEVRQF
jgi:hypothetical protein